MPVGRPISPLAIEQAIKAGFISREQARRLEDIEYTVHSPDRLPRAILVIGGILAVGAATLFLTRGWAESGPAFALVTSLVYVAVAAAGSGLCRRRGHATGEALLACVAVVCVALVLAAGLRLLGLWPAGAALERWYHDDALTFLYMQAGTAAAAAFAQYRVRHVLLSVPLAIALAWTLADAGVAVVGTVIGGDRLMALTGAVIAGLGMWIESRHGRDPDLAFGFYLVGVGLVWAAGTDLAFDTFWLAGAYLAGNAGLILTGALMRRRTFAVFGGAGIVLEIGHLARESFADSFAFPVAVFALGMAVIAGGVCWQRLIDRRPDPLFSCHRNK